MDDILLQKNLSFKKFDLKEIVSSNGMLDKSFTCISEDNNSVKLLSKASLTHLVLTLLIYKQSSE